MDAANVDLKGFTERFYNELTASRLEPVKETLRYLVRETKVWTEITTLLIPGQNDSDAELDEMTGWIAAELGVDVPLHFSAFHPDYRMPDVPATPLGTLQRARDIAMGNGLRYVYTGNVHDAEGDTTRCPSCNAAVIERDWYELKGWRLDESGCCSLCRTPIAGRFDPHPGSWGRRRLPVSIETFR